MLIWAPQRNTPTDRYTHKDTHTEIDTHTHNCVYIIHFKELAHIIMEVKKFQDVQLANWKHRRVRY